jgi:hypothetical protein
LRRVNALCARFVAVLHTRVVRIGTHYRSPSAATTIGYPQLYLMEIDSFRRNETLICFNLGSALNCRRHIQELRYYVYVYMGRFCN